MTKNNIKLVNEDGKIVGKDPETGKTVQIELGETTTESISTEQLQTEKKPVVNVKAHGAIGNGEIDDTEAFKSAVQEVEDAGGGTIFLPKGDYLITPKPDEGDDYPIELPRHTTFKGVGPRQSHIITGAVEADNESESWGIIKTKGSDGDEIEQIHLSEFSLDGRQSEGVHDTTPGRVEGEVINITNVHRFSITNLEVWDAGSDGIRYAWNKQAYIVGNYCHDNSGWGIHTSGGNYEGVVAFNVVENNGHDTTRGGIDQTSWDEGSHDNVFVGNVAIDNYQNYGIEGSGASFVANQSLGDTEISDDLSGVENDESGEEDEITVDKVSFTHGNEFQGENIVVNIDNPRSGWHNVIEYEAEEYTGNVIGIAAQLAAENSGDGDKVTEAVQDVFVESSADDWGSTGTTQDISDNLRFKIDDSNPYKLYLQLNVPTSYWFGVLSVDHAGRRINDVSVVW